MFMSHECKSVLSPDLRSGHLVLFSHRKSHNTSVHQCSLSLCAFRSSTSYMMQKNLGEMEKQKHSAEVSIQQMAARLSFIDCTLCLLPAAVD